MRPRTVLLVTVFLVWSLFTWVGRLRNVLTDETLSGAERTGPLLLAASFVLPALVLAALWWRHVGGRWTGRDIAPVAPALRTATLAFAAWTVAVWVVRAVDIALFSDHEVGFVVVHTVLAVVAIALSVAAGASLVRSHRRAVAHLR